MSAVRVGLAGFSGLGQQDHQSSMYLGALRAESDVIETVAVATLTEAERPRADAAATLLGTKSVTFDELLADDAVEAICLAAPPAQRADAVIAALRAGKHVLADKPLALTAAEVARVVAAQALLPAGERPVVAVAHHQRFNAKLMPTAAALAGGRIGVPWHIQGDFLVAGGEPVPGGELVNFGLYAVDNLLFLTGQRIGRVHAHALGGDTGAEAGSLFALHLDHCDDQGATRITSTMVVGRTVEQVGIAPGGVGTHRYRISGSHGLLTLEDPDDGIKVRTATAATHHSVDPGTLSRLVRDWALAITGAGAPAVGPAEALVVARVLDGAAESLRTGQPVSLGERESPPSQAPQSSPAPQSGQAPQSSQATQDSQTVNSSGPTAQKRSHRR